MQRTQRTISKERDFQSPRQQILASAMAANNDNKDVDPNGGWFFQTPQFKRFSVYMSIALSMASLITGAIAQLMDLTSSQQRGLAVTGIAVNAVSVTLSALTSLDWRSEAIQNKKFLDQLLGMVQVHGDGKMSLVALPRET